MKTIRPCRLFFCLFLLVACGLAQALRPRLIVVIAVDQMRADYLDRFAAYESKGLHQFASGGANFINANYDHTPTETGPGHSTLMSGRNPARTGIVSNTWFDRASNKKMYCVFDPQSPLVGDVGDGVSPRNFVGESFGDQFQRAFPGARVFSASLKDRAAVLMAGKRPTQAFWFSTTNGNFISGAYYAPQLPDWVTQFNRGSEGGRMVDSFAGKSWTLQLPANSPAYGGDAGKFPHPMPPSAGHDLYEAVFGSPYGDELLEKFVEAMVAANQIGGGEHPDLLTVSFSSNDSVGHAYGPDSAEIADEQIRLDSTIGALMDFINQRVGAERVLWALSADHGAEPTPEAERSRGNTQAKRIPMTRIVHSAEQQLADIFHLQLTFHWFAAVIDPGLYFDGGNLITHRLSIGRVRQALATEVHVDGIAGFYDVTRLDRVKSPIGQLLRNSYFPGRSGDVYFIPSEWTLISDQPTGTSHSNPYPYDTHVPLCITGMGIAAARITTPVHVADFAPTLAALLGMRWQTDEPKSESRAALIQRAASAAH